MPVYKKAPKYEGKHLTVMVGRGNVKLEDGVEYTDSRFAKFVKEGFMVEVVPSEEEPVVVKKAVKKAVPVPKVVKKPTVPPAKSASVEKTEEREADQGSECDS